MWAGMMCCHFWGFAALTNNGFHHPSNGVPMTCLPYGQGDVRCHGGHGRLFAVLQTPWPPISGGFAQSIK